MSDNSEKTKRSRTTKKSLFVLEPSRTVQQMISEAAVENKKVSGKLKITFFQDGLKLLFAMCEKVPDLIFLNAKVQNPKSMELLRLLRSLDSFKDIPCGMYTIADFIFEEDFALLAGADVFIHLEESNIKSSLEKILSLCGQRTPPKKLPNDLLRNLLLIQLFKTIKHLQSVEQIAHEYLKLVAISGELPAVSLFLLQNDSPHSYFLASAKITKDEKKDFLKVSAVDFEKIVPEAQLPFLKYKSFPTDEKLDSYRVEGIPLSTYQDIPLSFSDGKSFGSLHVIKEGNISERQNDLLHFSAHYVGMIFENALMLEKKLFFENRIRKAFSRFVPEQIIDELVAQTDVKGKTMLGEKRKVAILFSDIRSFTSISECNKPEVMVAFLNRYFTTMVNIIKKHGGTIDKFIGDAIMALFGAPVSYEDNARRAVAAACEMRKALGTVPLEDLILPEGLKFNIGIGIHYGDVTVGSIGSADKTDYTVIGDTVNLASRLEGLTKTYGSMILVSESVKRDIEEGQFTFRYLDDVKVKGKAKAVPIYAVDKSADDFSAKYRDCYAKGLDLYQQGTWHLAKEYFEKALAEAPGDKAAVLMQSRCDEFIKNPPENWDGAITFTTK